MASCKSWEPTVPLRIISRNCRAICHVFELRVPLLSAYCIFAVMTSRVCVVGASRVIVTAANMDQGENHFMLLVGLTMRTPSLLIDGGLSVFC